MKTPVTVYAEMTPNPQAMKFVTDIYLCERPIEYSTPQQAENNLLAKKLFEFQGIKNVFILSSFITLTKEGTQDWYELLSPIREAIKNYFLSNDVPVLTSVPATTVSPVKEIIR